MIGIAYSPLHKENVELTKIYADSDGQLIYEGYFGDGTRMLFREYELTDIKLISDEEHRSSVS